MLDTRGQCIHCGKPIEPGNGVGVSIGEKARTVCGEACQRVVELIVCLQRRKNRPNPVVDGEQHFLAFDNRSV